VEVRGSGKYSLGKVLKGLAKKGLIAGGKALGTALAGKSGGEVGSSAGSWLSKVVGCGSYNVLENTLVHSHPTPTFGASRDEEDGIIIQHHEYISDVRGSVDFATQTHSLNPGNPAMFPWLSTIAQSFTEYEWLGALVEYRPTSGNIAGASPALGSVMLSSNYNVHEPPYASKAEVDSAQYTTQCVPCEGMLHPVECKKNVNLFNRYLVKTLAVVGGDEALYDMCNVQISTQGMQSAYTIGELWVTYHIRLTRPVIPHLSNGWSGMDTRGEVPVTDAGGFVSALVPMHSYMGNALDIRWTPIAGAANLSIGRLAMPNITGDYFVTCFFKYGNSYAADLGPAWGATHLVPTECQGITVGASMTAYGNAMMLVQPGVIATTHGTNSLAEMGQSSAIFHVDADTYPSWSASDMLQRSIYLDAIGGADRTLWIGILVIPIKTVWSTGYVNLSSDDALHKRIDQLQRMMELMQSEMRESKSVCSEFVLPAKDPRKR
jgi:hypothetical protein